MVWRTTRARNLLGSGAIQDYLSESSESEFADDEEKPWPPEERTGRPSRRPPRYPRPHSFLFRTADGRRARGNKHSRRWENSEFLSTLHQIPEEELEDGFTPLPPHTSTFKQLFTSDKSMQVWNAFSSCSEEEQKRLLSRETKTEGKREKEKEVTPEQCLRQIDRHIRSVLQHNRHLPLELVRAMEEELLFLFSIDHRALVVQLQTGPFYRLLVHGVCQYMSLTSNTEHCDSGCLMVIECRQDNFTPPPSPLTSLLHPHS